jgi:hypothetical protein
LALNQHSREPVTSCLTHALSLPKEKNKKSQPEPIGQYQIKTGRGKNENNKTTKQQNNKTKQTKKMFPVISCKATLCISRTTGSE